MIKELIVSGTDLKSLRTAIREGEITRGDIISLKYREGAMEAAYYGDHEYGQFLPVDGTPRDIRDRHTACTGYPIMNFLSWELVSEGSL